MLESLREVVYVDTLPQGGVFFLAGDIGGTNSNFGIIETTQKVPRLIVSLHVKSQLITDYAALIAEVCAAVHERYNITFYAACLGAAGVVSENRHYAKPTNLHVVLDTNGIAKAANIPEVILINDFEAVVLGIDLINPADIVIINKGTMARPHAHKACLGAGTGLGKSALLWNDHVERYLPISSEGGHGDAAAQAPHELALLDFIKKFRKHNCPVSWENVLSGYGIADIYQFLATQKEYPQTAITTEIAQTRFDPDRISRYAKEDAQCRDTFLHYARWYARCAKNFVLDVLALNGIYIAGGIAAKNVALFHEPIFMEEFMRCGKQGALLKKVPVYVIADYNVSLYGAYAFMELYKQGLI